MKATIRETEVAKMIYMGYTVKEIASLWDVSPHTVVSHKRNLFEKTGARNVADVCRWYVQNTPLNELFEGAVKRVS